MDDGGAHQVTRLFVQGEGPVEQLMPTSVVESGSEENVAEALTDACSALAADPLVFEDLESGLEVSDGVLPREQRSRLRSRSNRPGNGLVAISSHARRSQVAGHSGREPDAFGSCAFERLRG